MMKQTQTAIGIDLGGTKIKAAVVDANGQILDTREWPSLAERGPEPIIRDMLAMVHELDPKGELAVGVGVAGQVRADTGAVSFAPNLKWRDIPLRANMESQLHRSVTVLNDVRAHTWGEWMFGSGKGCQDLVCLFIGTGVGGGVVSGGKMVVGATNMAGELGHMIIDRSGPVCGCGNKGCLEAWVSGIHLEKQMAGITGERITARQIAEAYQRQDTIAVKLLNSAAEALVLGAINIVHAFNPQRLILGGGIIHGFPHLVERVKAGVNAHALTAAKEGLVVTAAALGNDAALIGAAYVAQQRFIGIND